MHVDRVERARRRRLVEAHMAAENAHDLDAIVATFAANPSNSFNMLAQQQDTPETIRQGHALLGFGPTPGALSGTQVVPEREHFTDQAIVVEGHVTGRHVGDFFGVPPSDQLIALPYVAVYIFDHDDLLASERVIMDTSHFGKAIVDLVGGTP